MARKKNVGWDMCSISQTCLSGQIWADKDWAQVDHWQWLAQLWTSMNRSAHWDWPFRRVNPMNARHEVWLHSGWGANLYQKWNICVNVFFFFPTPNHFPLMSLLLLWNLLLLTLCNKKLFQNCIWPISLTTWAVCSPRLIDSDGFVRLI